MSILDMKFWSLIGIKKKPNARWAKYYNKKTMNLDVPNVSIYQLLKNKSLENNYKDNIALEYYGTKITYQEFFRKIDKCARAFRTQGVRRGDVVTILSANTPEAIISFYALNKIGAVANMVHPLSSQNQIKEFINSSNSKMVITIDSTYDKVRNIIYDTDALKVVVVAPNDSMKFPLKQLYKLTDNYVKLPKVIL